MKNYIKHGLLLFEHNVIANKINFCDIELLDYDKSKEVKKTNYDYALCIFPYLVGYNFEDVV